MFMKLNLSILAVNVLTALLLGAFIYHPTKVSGIYSIPHTEVTVSFGEQPMDITKFVINASQLKPREKL